ncbi:hypothetical protein [Sphingomonas sp. ERG5]|uniref:hypothetical protein n=1 Tax=Sphingomonas sp. ERG5 TaxID=1381597 RepID=UPI00054C7B34|nr:hypothetical protein [Sphingomonas sp. ERG5]
MDVELAEERVLVVRDRFSMDHAEGRAWTKRVEAFGTMAKLTGFLSRPRDEEFEVVYRERRLQPFWRIACTALHVYERNRGYRVTVAPNVQEVMLEGTVRPVTDGGFAISGVEHCRDEAEREYLFDAIRGTPDTALAAHLKHEADVSDAAALAAVALTGTVVVPPEAKASMLVRDVLAGAIVRIEADRVLEEKLSLHLIDLYYRPVYAFRYRWQGKEAVVEFDGVTGDTRIGGSTFEQHVGKLVDAEFLINAGVEAAGLFIPGVRLAEIVISRSLNAKRDGVQPGAGSPRAKP